MHEFIMSFTTITITSLGVAARTFCLSNTYKRAAPAHLHLHLHQRRNSQVILCEGRIRVEDDLSTFVQILPKDVCENLLKQPKRDELLEVVLDLGRCPEARFLGEDGGVFLRSEEITWKDLDAAQASIGEFGGDNRAGIEGTLHRISAIRSRKGVIVGLTCRVGRAVNGHVDMVRDLLPYGQSILFLGRPGVGKTTVIREIARVLADELHKRVVIVDTSNEIGGDGDIPHSAIGGARRMQVPEPAFQHKVMIEAVENHMPEVVIVDEIGMEAEALACRTIAERGVMLVGTAHGERLENLIKNTTLCDLIGGVQSVTLGDDEARARGTQKSVLERKAPPTFPLLIEMRERSYWVAHRTERSVDILLHGGKPLVEVRTRDKSFNIVIERWKTYEGKKTRWTSLCHNEIGARCSLFAPHMSGQVFHSQFNRHTVLISICSNMDSPILENLQSSTVLNYSIFMLMW